MAMKMSPNQNSPSVDTAILDNFAQILETYNLIKDERRDFDLQLTCANCGADTTADNYQDFAMGCKRLQK